MESAFIHLSFRIRFSGEESAVAKAAGGTICHPEEAESFAARRTPNEGSMHSRRERSRDGLPDLAEGEAKGNAERLPTPLTNILVIPRSAATRACAFIYLSFRIRFSGEESAVAKAAGLPRVSLPLRDLGWEKLSIHPVKLSSLSDFQE